MLIVHGERDGFIAPRHGQTLAALTLAARLVLVSDAGHGNILETAGYLNALRMQLDQM